MLKFKLKMEILFWDDLWNGKQSTEFHPFAKDKLIIVKLDVELDSALTLSLEASLSGI